MSVIYEVVTKNKKTGTEVKRVKCDCKLDALKVEVEFNATDLNQPNVIAEARANNVRI